MEKVGSNWAPTLGWEFEEVSEGEETTEATDASGADGQKRSDWDRRNIRNGSRVIQHLSITLLVRFESAVENSGDAQAGREENCVASMAPCVVSSVARSRDVGCGRAQKGMVA